MTTCESALQIVDALEELREPLPPELFTLVAAAAEFPTIEDLDI
jgi:EXLDI family protein